MDFLGSKVLPEYRTDHAQSEDGYGAVILLQSSGDVAVLGIEICSPAQSAENAQDPEGSQNRAARRFRGNSRRPEGAPVLIPFASRCSPIVFIRGLLRHVYYSIQQLCPILSLKFNHQNALVDVFPGSTARAPA